MPLLGISFDSIPEPPFIGVQSKVTVCGLCARQDLTFKGNLGGAHVWTPGDPQ